jgi:ribosomal protein S18 acetylase RimI-like enzyme
LEVRPLEITQIHLGRRWVTVMAITIRPYLENDREIVRELTILAFEGVSIDHNIDETLGPVAGRDWRWRKARDVDRDIDGAGTTLAVAVDEATADVVGYVTMQCDEQTLIGWIHNLVVRSETRGHGLGRRLIEHALEHFRAAGMTVAKIETLEQNAIGRHLYPSAGFIDVAHQIHFAMALNGRGGAQPQLKND